MRRFAFALLLVVAFGCGPNEVYYNTPMTLKFKAGDVVAMRLNPEHTLIILETYPNASNPDYAYRVRYKAVTGERRMMYVNEAELIELDAEENTH